MTFDAYDACRRFWTITDDEVHELKSYICNRLHYAYGETPLTPEDIRIRGPRSGRMCGGKEYFEMMLVKKNRDRDPLFDIYISKEDGSVKRHISYYFCRPDITIESFRTTNIHVHGLELSLYELLEEAAPEAEIDVTRLMFIQWGELPSGLTRETLRKHHIEVQYYPYGNHAIDSDILELVPEEHRNNYFYEWEDDHYYGDMAIISLEFVEDGHPGSVDDEWEYYDHILCECDSYGVDMNHPFDPFHEPYHVILNHDMFNKVAQYCAMKFPSAQDHDDDHDLEKEKETNLSSSQNGDITV